MLNSDAKRKAIARLEDAARKQNELLEQAKARSTELFEIRRETSDRIISAAESYVNELANSPKEFRKEISEFRIQRDRFDHVVDEITAKAKEVAHVAGGVAGAGAVAGVGVAALGPSAAMAIATTFGTASTGTAIASLSGAAATNAALAWLGGGAIAAGGGGMAGGGAFLALAGPVGIGIGAVAVGSGVLWARAKNKRIAEQAYEEAAKALAGCHSLERALAEVNLLKVQTLDHANGASEQLTKLRMTAPHDYTLFDLECKQELAALVNNIRSLSQLLNKSVK